MHFDHWLSGRAWPPGCYIDWLAAGIAERCLSAVPEEVREHAVRMTLAEARGYLRARTSRLVAAETDTTIRRKRLDVRLAAPLATQAVEDLVSLSVQAILVRDAKARAAAASRRAA
jgi:hypothetical protein